MADARIPLDLSYPGPEDVPPAPVQYCCTQCGRIAPWGPGWSWYTDGKRPRRYADPEPLFFACSPECLAASPYAAQPVISE